MRTKFALLLAFLLSIVLVKAQQQPFNPSLDLWKGGYFDRCCGLALASPTDWGIVEQPMQMAINHFVFKETDSVNVHSGYFSARLRTDTTSLDSAGDVSHNISVLVPGKIACAGMITYGAMGIAGHPAMTNAYSTGMPFSGNPLWLNFYIKIYHPAPDTATYAYVFTKWDSVAMKEDTLAVNIHDIQDDDVIQSEWTLFTDTIHYILPGTPDSLHLIFRGGVNGDPGKVGNTVWVDDISFYYPTSGLVYLDKDDAVSIYPNPASNLLNVKVDGNMKGYRFQIFDVIGREIKNMIIENPSFTITTNSFADGDYFYRLLDKEQSSIQNGKFSVVK